jgi:hypothetical protein
MAPSPVMSAINASIAFNPCLTAAATQLRAREHRL